MGLVDFTRNFTNETIKNDLKTIKPSDQVTQLFQNFYSKANQSQVCITNVNFSSKTTKSSRYTFTIMYRN